MFDWISIILEYLAGQHVIAECASAFTAKAAEERSQKIAKNTSTYL
jgi:hypothetical protein